MGILVPSVSMYPVVAVFRKISASMKAPGGGYESFKWANIGKNPATCYRYSVIHFSSKSSTPGVDRYLGANARSILGMLLSMLEGIQHVLRQSRHTGSACGTGDHRGAQVEAPDPVQCNRGHHLLCTGGAGGVLNKWVSDRRCQSSPDGRTASAAGQSFRSSEPACHILLVITASMVT